MTTLYAYGMRQLKDGKWEAFRVKVKAFGDIEPLSPMHREALTELRWHESKVPDPKEPDNPRALLAKRVLGPLPTGKWVERRGERLELAMTRMQEAQRHEQVLRLPSKRRVA